MHYYLIVGGINHRSFITQHLGTFLFPPSCTSNDSSNEMTTQSGFIDVTM
ncbi:uncharacterized protein DS421_19g672220 [Arachis hypogaea]|uniref:Uncharacterized protein n=1 Tax=Arachis hypogaea TaxID=3818 RepID=A0A6B9VGF8_ARAHY|nr:uncharacterized protein DS421_19g672220 [Arachis hypogaea]